MLQQLRTVLNAKEQTDRRQPVLPRRFGSLHKDSSSSLEEPRASFRTHETLRPPQGLLNQPSIDKTSSRPNLLKTQTNSLE